MKNPFESQEKRIGQCTYRATRMSYGEAMPLLWLAASKLLPSIEALGGVTLFRRAMAAHADGGRSPLTSLAEMDVGVIGKAFRILFDRASFEDAQRFASAFAGKCWVSTPTSKGFVPLASIEEAHWPSRYGEFLEWMLWCTEVHFGPFSVAGLERSPSEKE